MPFLYKHTSMYFIDMGYSIYVCQCIHDFMPGEAYAILFSPCAESLVLSSGIMVIMHVKPFAQ